MAELRNPCDMVNVLDEPADQCPGIAGHCARGQHCTSTDASCAASARCDHDGVCCECGELLGRSTNG